MLTRDQLASLLREFNVEDVAREAGVSVKTIYRLRHRANSPTLDTAQKLVEACERLRTLEAKAA